jgi:hypothetical protein
MGHGEEMKTAKNETAPPSGGTTVAGNHFKFVAQWRSNPPTDDARYMIATHGLSPRTTIHAQQQMRSVCVAFTLFSHTL